MKKRELTERQQKFLDVLFEESPEAYISAITKLMNYTVPKLSSNEITDNTSKNIKIVSKYPQEML